MVVDLSSQMETQSKANQELFEKLMARIDSRMNSFKNELMEALGLNKFPPLVRNEELGNLAGVSEAVKIAGNSELLKTNREVEVSEGDAPCLVDNHMHEDSLQSLAKLEELSDINKEIDVEVTINNEELAVVVNCVVVDDLVMHKVVKKSYNCAEFVGMDYVGWVENLSGMNIDFASFVRIVLTSMRLVLQVEGELDVFYGNPRMQGCSGCPFDPGGIVVAERGMEDEWEYENGQETRVVVDSVLSGNAKRLVSHSVEQQIAECTVLDSVPYEIVEYKDCDVEEIKAVVESERVKNSGTSNVPDELISKQMEGGTPIAYFPIEFRALNPLGNYDYMKELLGALRIASALQAVFGYSELIWIFLTLINPLFVASILSRIQRVLAGLLGIGIEAVSLTENVHNIAATKMGSRREASLGAVVVIALPLVGKVGGFIAFIPKVKVAALLCFMWVVLTALDTPNLHYSLLFLLVLIMGKHQKGNAFMGTGNLTLHLLLKGYINLLSLILEKLIHMRIVIMSLTSSHNFDPWGQGSLRGAGTVTPQEIRSKEEAELTETGTRTTPFYSLGCSLQKPLVIQQVEVAPPQAMEVRVKIKYTSLCHTDIYFWEAKGQTPLFPRIFGHEAAGIVESVGEGVEDLQVGDHVLPVFTGECGECAHCKSEESNMCDLLRINTERGVMLNDGKSRFSINGNPINHFLGTSTFSEYTVLHSGCLAKINPLAPLDKVCVLSCGISTGLGATLNVAKPKQGSSVAIFGLGAVGLAAAEGARISGASRIIGVDLNPKRFDEAKKFGVTEFVNPKDYDIPVQQVIAEMTNGGVDRSVECTGNINAMMSAFECVHDGWGVAVLVGVPNKEAVFMTKPINLLNERTLKGTFFGNYKPRTDLPSVVDMYMNKKLEVEKFITHRLPFSEINKAFDYMLRGEGLRCIISMED